MVDRERQRRLGRIGGLTAWSRNGADVMAGPAHAGFRRRFEQLVDPEGTLPEAERIERAERARRAHMLMLAEKSAATRAAKKKGAPDRKSERPVEARRDDPGEHSSAA